MTRDEEQSARILALAQAISHVIAGAETGEANTALTVVVACAVVADFPEPVWPIATREFKRQVDALLASKDHVDFLKASIRSLPHPGPGHA